MNKIPFSVSSRAAILIGRENISNSRGAMIELVKNAYDADSDYCFLLFDNSKCIIKETLTEDEFKFQIENKIPLDLLNRLYFFEGQSYKLIKDTTEINQKYLNLYNNELTKLINLYIIDFGDGMTQSIIENYWMMIGTANKLFSIRTNKKNRIKSGAKGIGRFALDKLGGKAKMLSITEDKQGVFWSVNWNDFEVPNKKINEVYANVTTFCNTDLLDKAVEIFDDINLKDWILSLFSQTRKTAQFLEESKFGTIIKIEDLHDKWNLLEIEKLYNDLEVLVPPKEGDNFSIFLEDKVSINKFGEVLSTICDDYDYKIIANAKENGEIIITIFRNEFNFEIADKEFFDRKTLQESIIFNKEMLLKKNRIIITSYQELLSNINTENLHQLIGPFDLTLYFLKKTMDSKNSKKFLQKDFNASKRKKWLSTFSGIKIYRDNFRVRPYGEISEPAFDWLGLGGRKAENPASVAKEEGGYRLGPDNLSGTVKISRLNNFDIKDKSSREGLQETESFKLFKRLLVQIISQLEADRAFLARELRRYDEEKNADQIALQKAKDLAKKALDLKNNTTEEDKSSNESTNNNEEYTEEVLKKPEVIALANLVQTQTTEIEKLINEQKLLRGLASSGIVAAALGHDLDKIKDSLLSRIDELKELILPSITPEDFSHSQDYENPFVLMDEIKKEDKNISTWLGFSLGFTRKDKRKAKDINLYDYFSSFRRSWASTLADRAITITLDVDNKLFFQTFEIDLDSIFINLLTNSIDAFNIHASTQERIVNIVSKLDGEYFTFKYKDNGPGLSSIPDANMIFTPLFTTKVNHQGEEISTGLGMYIVKTIVDEYNGKIILHNEKDKSNGFDISIVLPAKLFKLKEREVDEYL